MEESYSALEQQGSVVSLPALLDHLGSKGIVNLLVEGGGSVHGAFFDAGLVDKVYAFVAPVIVGGETSLSPVEGSGVIMMDDAWTLEDVRTQQIGPDWLIIGYPSRESGVPDSFEIDGLEDESDIE